MLFLRERMGILCSGHPNAGRHILPFGRWLQTAPSGSNESPILGQHVGRTTTWVIFLPDFLGSTPGRELGERVHLMPSAASVS